MQTNCLLFLLSILCLLYNQTQAQHKISGTVISAEDDLPLIGVNVILKDGGGLGTVTNVEGKYELILPKKNGVLIFSYIGYQTQEIAIDGRNILDVSLSSDAEKLNEVVVTALGIKRQKRALGYSSESFDGVELLQSNAPNLINSLSGKSAGVQISTPNGVDGGTSRIVIRGNNNIDSNNQPLIVVDGVPLENAPGLENIGRGVDWGSAINNINPQDIEEVNILKGPTASALYGARGANGVVLITTKRGSQQKGLGVSYSIQHKIIQPYYFREVQNEYGVGGPVSLLAPTFKTDADGNFLHPSGIADYNAELNGKNTVVLFGNFSTGASWGPKMEGQMIKWWDGEMRPFNPQPDNQKAFFQDGQTTTHNVSFSGGSNVGSIRVSATHSSHKAIVPNSNYQQNTINLGARLNVSSKVKADLSLSYIDYYRLNSPTLGDDNNNSFAKGMLYSFPRSYKGLEEELNFLPDGSRNDYGGTFPFKDISGNLWWNVQNNNTELTRDKLIGALNLTYDITDWLTASARLGMDFNLNQFEVRNQPTDALGIENGFYANDLLRDRVNNNDFLITAHKDNFLKERFNASLSFGGTQWQRNLYGLSARNAENEWINPYLYAFNNFVDEAADATDNPTVNENRYRKKINSLYGFLNLSYDDFLFLEMTGRNDWSSALPADNNSYFYPSASLSFIPTEVFQFKAIKNTLSFWKLRAAYAQTGSDTDPYQLDFVYRTGSFGGSQTATLPSTVPPIALQPQRANSYEIGTTIGLWQDKLNVDFTYYQINSFSQILDAPLPASSGADRIRINTGELQNKGIEFSANFVVLKRQHFFWETGLNISRNRNFVISLGNGAKSLELANIWGSNGPAISVEEGQEYGTIVGYDYVYHETANEPIITDDGREYLVTSNRISIGNASPDFIGGWTMRLGWKNFRLNTLVDTKWGGDIYSGSYTIGLENGQSPETLIERNGGGLPYTDPEGNARNIGVVLDGVYADGTPNDKVVHYYYKHIGTAGGWGAGQLSTTGIVENTWIKLREVALSYEFENSLLSKSKVFQNLSLSLVGRDLFYLYTTLPDNINPEGSNGSGNAQGLEWAAFPGARSVTLGVSVGF